MPLGKNISANIKELYMEGFKSLEQMRYLYANKPLLATEMAKNTTSVIDLPKRFVVDKKINAKNNKKRTLPNKAKILI